MHTGDIIRHLRKQHDMTQEELANLLKLKKSTIQKYECGKVQNIKLKTIQKMCGIFRITPFAFVFPDSWEEVHLPKDENNEFYQKAKIYFSLTEEGKYKVLNYIEDIGENEKYKRQDEFSVKMYQNDTETDDDAV